MMVNALIFVILQGLAINGLSQSMGDGMILSGYKRWLKKQKEWIGKPMGLCVQCCASVGGTITFWPVVVYSFGFRWMELFAWIMDIFVLTYINLWLYKKN